MQKRQAEMHVFSEIGEGTGKRLADMKAAVFGMVRTFKDAETDEEKLMAWSTIKGLVMAIDHLEQEAVG
jgi:hypothetical protein